MLCTRKYPYSLKKNGGENRDLEKQKKKRLKGEGVSYKLDEGGAKAQGARTQPLGRDLRPPVRIGCEGH